MQANTVIVSKTLDEEFIEDYASIDIFWIMKTNAIIMTENFYIIERESDKISSLTYLAFYLSYFYLQS